jgi:hypothetical protein
MAKRDISLLQPVLARTSQIMKREGSMDERGLYRTSVHSSVALPPLLWSAGSAFESK